MIADLDALVLTCRHENARTYISEAVNAYKAGAYRSAIIATWISVAFDFIDKLNDLAETDNKEAQRLLNELSATQGKTDSGSIESALEFERELIGHMKNVGFLNDYDAISFDRLRQDRNLCAHPTAIDHQTPYTPTPEQARSHIRNAIEKLLSQPAVFGKSALEAITSQVLGDYFPVETDRAKLSLKEGPLETPNKYLLRNFLKVSLKGIVNDDNLTDRQRSQFVAAVSACAQLHSHDVLSLAPNEFRKLLKGNGDAQLRRSVIMLSRVDDSELWLDASSKVTLQEFLITSGSEIDSALLVAALKLEFLQDSISRIVNESPLDTLIEHYESRPSSELLDFIISRYIGEISFIPLNKIASRILSDSVQVMTAEQCQILLDAYLSNDAIRKSFQGRHVIFELGMSSKISSDNDRWEAFYSGLIKLKDADEQLALITDLQKMFTDLPEFQPDSELEQN